MKLLHALGITSFLFFILLCAPVARAVGTGSFSWSSPSATTIINTSGTVTLSIQTGTSMTTGADVLLSYDASAIDIQQITFSGNPYSQNFSSFDAANGRIHLTSSFTDVVSSFTGTQTFAQITYKPKKAGTTSFAFQCSAGRTNETNITEKGTGADVVDCAALSDFSITATNATANPTATPTATPTSTPATNGTSKSCNQPTAPSGLTARAQSNDSVVLQWNRGTNVTRYVLQYGTAVGQYQYGVSNLGDTTAFLVGYLQSAKTYYFAIAGANDCGTSSFVTASAQTTGGTTIKKPGATSQPLPSNIPTFATLVSPKATTSPLPTAAAEVAGKDESSTGMVKPLIVVGIGALILFLLLAFLYSRQGATSDHTPPQTVSTPPQPSMEEIHAAQVVQPVAPQPEKPTEETPQPTQPPTVTA